MMHDNYRGQENNILECKEAGTADNKNSKHVSIQNTEMIQMKKILIEVSIPH